MGYLFSFFQPFTANKKKQLKSCMIIDELPTIFFEGLDNLIATVWSNKVAIVLGFQKL